MKLIPDAIARKVAEKGLLASENSPKILFVGGVLGMVGSTVLACRSTLRLEEVLDEIERNKNLAHMAKHVVEQDDYEGDKTYPESEYRKDLATISVRGIGQIAKLYAPAILLGGASIAALTKSQSILQERNLALTAAYAAVDTAFTRYRERVVEKYGAEVDRDLRFDSEEIEIVDEDTGKVVKTKVATGVEGSAYARWYDSESSSNWSPDPDLNLLFLRNAQSVINDRLKARGHIFLNEVYQDLGLAHTKAGAIVGWRWNKGSGDDYIDFGIWDGSQDMEANEFFTGREGSILLDFNVDGVIYDKLGD